MNLGLTHVEEFWKVAETSNSAKALLGFHNARVTAVDVKRAVENATELLPGMIRQPLLPPGGAALAVDDRTLQLVLERPDPGLLERWRRSGWLALPRPDGDAPYCGPLRHRRMG